MKKSILLSIMVLLLTVFLVSCGGGLMPVNQMAVVVTNWNAGPGVENAVVRVFESGTENLLGNGVTNEKGGVGLNLIAKPEKIDILVLKEGHARSLVSGLKTTSAINNYISVILQEALREPDPFAETDPVVQMQCQALTGLRSQQREDDEPITGPFEVTVQVESQRDVKVIFQPLLDQIPGSASVTSNSQLVRSTDTATFEISPTGFDGEIALFTTVYDENNNRVVKVEYLEIEGTDPGEVQMYQPMTFVDFSEHVGDYTIENIRSYTRRGGVNLRNDDRTAPAETNLWTQLYWTDWTSLNDYSGPGSLLPNPGERPDGYNLYRSGDGEVYQKFAFIPESSVEGLAKQICEEADIWFDVDRVANSNPVALDGSIYVMPSYPIYYRVTAVYGTLESTPTELGSVIPLDAFQVVSDHPAHEETVDTLTPTFQWQPSKALTSDEGTPEYRYGLYLDQQGAPADEILACVDALSNFFNFRTDEAEQISVTFTGKAQNQEWGCLWKWYNEETETYRDYESDELLNNTQYSWYVPLAYAVVEDDDSKAYSIASDYKFEDASWGIDPFGGFPFGDRNRFETVVE